MTSHRLRPDLYVVARLLETLAREPGGLRKTPLQQAAGLNYTVFERYLDLLAAKELVRVDTDEGGADRVTLTPKGADALRFLTSGIRTLLGRDA